MFEDLDFIKEIDDIQEVLAEEAEYIDQSLGHTTIDIEESESGIKECDCTDNCGECISSWRLPNESILF